MKIIDWFKKNTASLVLLILIALGASFFLGKCSTRKQLDNQVSNILALRDTVKATIVVINGLSNSVSEKEALILTQKDALDAAILEKERLKKLALSSVVTNADLTGTIKIVRDSLKLIPGYKIITIKDTSGLHDYMRIPFTLLDEEEENLHLLAGISANKHPYFSLSVPFKGTMTVGWKKAGFLKTQPVGIFTTTNPYIHVDDMQVVIIQNPGKWYDKWWVHALGGAVIFETARQLLLK